MRVWQGFTCLKYRKLTYTHDDSRQYEYAPDHPFIVCIRSLAMMISRSHSSIAAEQGSPLFLLKKQLYRYSSSIVFPLLHARKLRYSSHGAATACGTFDLWPIEDPLLLLGLDTLAAVGVVYQIIYRSCIVGPGFLNGIPIRTAVNMLVS